MLGFKSGPLYCEVVTFAATPHEVGSHIIYIYMFFQIIQNFVGHINTHTHRNTSIKFQIRD